MKLTELLEVFSFIAHAVDPYSPELNSFPLLHQSSNGRHQ